MAHFWEMFTVTKEKKKYLPIFTNLEGKELWYAHHKQN